MCFDPATVSVLDPIGRPRVDPSTLTRAPRPTRDMVGARVTIVDNRMNGMDVLTRELVRILAAEFRASVRHAEMPHFPPIHSFTSEAVTDLFGGADLVLVGLGNCGSCTTWDARVAAIAMAHAPVLQIVTEPFLPLALSATRTTGFADPPLAVLPGPDVTQWTEGPALEAAARRVLAAIAPNAVAT